ncbi:cytosine permease [Naasia sp. SYSU D00948]|uniref:cytosine permease n=1 Tax=Naasia sp. SYSU D00948 TaxID=2817379 RepID=UPI001B301687|nr:cytosine permease [Naasia sp. SYSU D00948]
MAEAWKDPAEARRARSSGDPSDDIHDDDELAAALRAQLDRLAETGAIPIIPASGVRPGAQGPSGSPAPVPSGTATTAGSPGAVPPVAGARPSWPTFAQADSARRGTREDVGEQPPPGVRRAGGAAAATPPATAPDRQPDDAGESRDEGDRPAGARSARDAVGSSPVPHFAPPVLPVPEAPPEPVDASSPLPEGRALELLEQLQPRLAEIRLDPQTYEEWQRSLLDISAEAGTIPPAPVSTQEEEPLAGPRRRSSAEPMPEEEEPLAGLRRRSSAVPMAEEDPLPGPRRRSSAADPLPVQEEEALPGPRRRSAAAPPAESPVGIPAEEIAAEEAAAEAAPVGPIPAAGVPTPPAPPREETGSVSARRTAEPAREIDVLPDAERAGSEVVPAGPGDARFTPPLGLPPEPSLLPSLPDLTSPVQLPQSLSALPVAEEHAEEVIDAELVDEDQPAETEAPPEADAPSSDAVGPVDVQLAVPAADAAALAVRSRPAVGEDDGDEGEEVERLDLDGITTDTGPIRTGSVPIVAVLDRDLDDDVDDVAPPEELLPVTGSIPLSPTTETGPVEPVSSASVRTGTISLPVPETGPPSPFAVEEADLRPIEEEQRLRRPIAQFWLWLAPNSSALTLILGGSLITLGISVRQAVGAAILGVALACLPLAANVLAVKRAAQPVAVASRASFGARGNILPTVLLLLVRLFWASALTWLAAGTVRSVLAAAGWDAVVSPTTVAVVFAVVFPVVACLVAVFGHGLLARVHLVLGGLSVVLLLLLLGLTAPLLDGPALLSRPDGSPLAVIGAAVAVASLLSVAWAAAGGELARYQQPGASGAATAAWASLGAAAPALLLTVWGVLLSASSSAGARSAPVATVLERLPAWAPVPLLLAAVLGLVAALATVLYSTGLTAGALGIPGSRAVRTVPAGLVAIAVGIVLMLADPPLARLLGDILPVLAVPVLAWTGIMAAELVLRPRAFDSGALLRRGGSRDVRWPTVVALVVISLLGIGLVGASESAPVAGYLWALFGVPADSALAQSNLGVPLAIVLGAATAYVVNRAESRPSGTPHS